LVEQLGVISQSFGGELWAKSPPRIPSDYLDGYPLLPHLLDVAAVASVLLPVVPCPVPLPCSEAWIAALVGLHDFGKATPGFQRKLGRKHVGGYQLETDQPDRHDINSVVLITDLLKARELPHRAAFALANAVGAHHGHPFSDHEVGLAGVVRDVSSFWAREHLALFEGVLEGCAVAGQPSLPSEAEHRSGFLQWLMGLTTLSDWLGSSDALCRWDRLSGWNDDCGEWFRRSSELARKSIQGAGLYCRSSGPALSGDEAIEKALGPGRSPRPLQLAIASLLDSLADEPGLIVIEAPMGEGKTEAALSCSVNARGLYLAMPTQATSNALFARLAEFLDRLRGPGSGTRVALAHGSGGPQAADLRLREIGLGTSDSNVQAGWWFRGSKRSLLCADGIGTVDQGLIGILNTRHGFLRLYGLSGRTVVFDEVHAYDTYTGGLIERLIVWLKVLGCRVVVMSATLPACKRDELLKAWSGTSAMPPQQESYPRLSWAVPGSIQSTSFSPTRRQRVVLRSISSDASVIGQQASDWARKGVRVLVVVNKVARAQSLFRGLDGVPSTLFHARFPMKQRLEIEQRVLGLFGPQGLATNGHVLVATQVAEQSLDIDFDVLITDPAPVDLVLQREGRIHRHDRSRPIGFEQPAVYLADLDEELPGEGLASYVYDRWDVLRSFSWLQNHRSLELPEDIDRSVQEVYGQEWAPEGPPTLLEALTQAWPDHQAELQSMQTQATQAALAQPDEWRINQSGTAPIDDDAADSGALRFGTRLGEDSQSVVPVYPDDLEALESRASELAKNYFRISHRQLLRAVRSAELPPGWRSLSGLGAHLPLILDREGWVQDSPVQARLDPVLGLVVGNP
jgi:CRISPR-associated endonuclease/helicase Cas3